MYPWRFEWSEPGELRSQLRWVFAFTQFLVRDALLNVGLYVPVGAAGHLALRRHRPRMWAIAGPVVVAAALSITVEILQIFQPLRTTSLVDVTANVTGSAVGVLLGLILAYRAENRDGRVMRDPVAAALLVIWIGWLLFPFIPVLSLSLLRHKVQIFVAASDVQPLRVLSSMAAWLVAGRLLAAEGVRTPAGWLCLSVLLIPAQLVAVSRQPLISDLIGAAAGIFACAFSSPRRAAGLLLVCVAARGLAPFDWTAVQPMNLVPFAALLSASWPYASFVLIEKCFFYGASVWSLHAAGIRLRSATAVTCALLLAIELLQTRLSGRTPEITDPIIALLLAVAFSARRD